MESKQYQSQLPFFNPIQKSAVEIHPSQKQSEFLETYLKLLNITSSHIFNDEDLEKKYEQEFSNYGIVYKAGRTHSQFSIQILQQSINSEVIEFKVNWGKFSATLSALNVKEDSFFHQLKFSKGSYGRVFSIIFQNQQFAIKCIHIEIFKNDNSAKIMAIKQFFLMKISAALKTGPNIKKWFGFDFIISKNCIEFAMQKCLQIQSLANIKFDTIRNSLSLLHNFKIIHFDLKPQNLMYSLAFQKLIFIDYGLSQIIGCKIGQKTQCSFRGTLDYVSPEMILNFQNQQKNLIDVYYNDAFCLKGILNKFKFLEKEKDLYDWNEAVVNLMEEMIQTPQVNNIICLFRLKYFIFKGQICTLISYFQQNKQMINKLFILQVLQFLYQVYPNEGLRHFFRVCFNSHHKQGINFTKLNQIYQSNFYFIKMKVKKQKQTYFHDLNIKLIQNNSTACQDYFYNKQNLKKYLIESNNFQVNKLVYLRIFMQYISFSNNIYNATMIERAEAALILLKKMNINQKLDINQQLYQNISFLQIVKKTIRYLILQLSNQFVQITGIISSSQIRIIKQIILDVLEHIFILKMLKCEQMIEWFQLLFQKPYLNSYDQLQLLIEIRNYNYWYLFSANSGADDYKRHFITDQVSVWYQNKFIAFQHSQNQEVKRIASFMLKVVKKQNNIQLLKQQSTNWHYLPDKIKQLLSFQVFFKQIAFSDTASTHKTIDSIYRLIPNKLKQRSFGFLFFIFIYFLQEERNIRKCQQIITIFQKNLTDPELINSLFLRPFIIITSCKNDVKTASEYIRNLLFLTNNLTLSIIIFHSDLIKLVFFLFQQFLQNNFQFLSEQQKLNVIQIISNIKNILIDFDFNSSQFHIKSNPNLTHSCLFFPSVQNIIQIKRCFSIITKMQYDNRIDLITLKDKLEDNCAHCHFIIQNILLLQQQKKMIDCRKLGNQSYQEKIIQVFQQIYNNMVAYPNKAMAVNFLTMNHYIFMEFCSIKQSYQIKYKGIRKLYFYLKQQNRLECYLFYNPYNFQLIKMTIFVLYYFESIQELVIFLNFLTQHLTNYFSQSYFQIIFSVFSTFISKQLKKINFLILYQSLQALQEELRFKNSELSVNNFNIIYYYFILIYSKDVLFQKCLLKIVNKIDILNLKTRIFFQSHIYRMIYAQHIIQKLKTNRKSIWLKKRMIKLFKIYGKNTVKYKIMVNSRNDPLRRMQNKAIQLGGPFDMQMLGLKPIYITVNRK